MTVTLAVLPLWVLAVIVAVPSFLPVILPDLLTDTTEEALLEKVQDAMVFFGKLTDSFLLWPTPTTGAFGERVTFEGALTTFTLHLAVTPLKAFTLTV